MTCIIADWVAHLTYLVINDLQNADSLTVELNNWSQLQFVDAEYVNLSTVSKSNPQL